MPSEKIKNVIVAGKFLASVFWDTHGVIFIDYLEKGKTLISDRVIGAFERKNRENRPQPSQCAVQ